MSDLKAYILFPGAAKNPLYAGWLDQLPIPAVVVREYDTGWLPPDDAGIVITHNHYRWEELSILRSIMEQSVVPLLILVDGILEYRNSFEHPDLAEGSMLQPLIGHKVACIGASQTRWIESWGNVGKCELVGLPRLDDLIGVARRQLPGDGPFRLLVASARTPWFNDAQREVTYRGMEAVQKALNELKSIEGRPVEVIWRMAEELHLNLGAPGYERRPGPIRETLSEVHAVITTPSTLQLEAAATGLPVAVVDLHNRPQMTPMAWTIAHEDQTRAVIQDLANPPPARILVQDAMLDDALQLHEPASQRMSRLVGEMVEQGRVSRTEDRLLEFPDRILEHPVGGFSTPQPSGSRNRLFPDNPVFQADEVVRLQTELSAALHEMGNYPEKYFHQRTANQKLRSYINWLRLLVRNRAATVEELSSALQNLRDRKDDRPVKND